MRIVLASVWLCLLTGCYTYSDKNYDSQFVACDSVSMPDTVRQDFKRRTILSAHAQEGSFTENKLLPNRHTASGPYKLSFIIGERFLTDPADIVLHKGSITSSRQNVRHGVKFLREFPAVISPVSSPLGKDLGLGGEIGQDRFLAYIYQFETSFDFDFENQEELTLSLDLEDPNRKLRTIICYRLTPKLNKGSGTYSL